MVNGQPVTREGGRWRPLTPGERAAYETSPMQAFGLGAVQGAAQIAEAPAMLATLGMGFDMQGAPQAPQNLTQPAQDVSQFQPNAVRAGNLATTMATVPAGSYVAAARLPATMASRVAARISAAGRSSAGQGLERTLGEATGLGPIQAVERGVESMGGFRFLQQRREQLLTKDWMAAMGAQGERMSAEVLGANAQRIGQGMDEVLAGDFNLSGATREALSAISNPGSKLKALLARADEAKGVVPGELVKNLRRQLTDRARAARGTDDLLADDLDVATEALMDDVERQLTPGQLETWRTLRIQYKNQKAAESIAEVRHSGTLTARQAGNALSRSYGNSYIRGQGIGDGPTDQLFQTTRRLAELRPYPESGTAGRIAPVIGAISGGVTGETGPQAVGQAAVGAAAPALVSSALGRALLAAGRMVP